ncbi:MAG: hypothetical protein V3V01_16195, partial [Acidimicrobiales bacterium]
ARAARQLTDRSRQLGYAAPTFRSPPRIGNAHRTIKRSGTSTSVAVQLRNRPWHAVVADMIEGTVVANDLGPGPAKAFRAQLWEIVEPTELQAA